MRGWGGWGHIAYLRETQGLRRRWDFRISFNTIPILEASHELWGASKDYLNIWTTIGPVLCGICRSARIGSCPLVREGPHPGIAYWYRSNSQDARLMTLLGFPNLYHIHPLCSIKLRAVSKYQLAVDDQSQITILVRVLCVSVDSA